MGYKGSLKPILQRKKQVKKLANMSNIQNPISLYWLVNRDPYINSLFKSLYNWVV